ncbi:2'-5' RNA ligase family protein [Cyclobacterium xiamenense]|uniref:2'-5' RNA ligase family protein n=1 Tax=Cyclobacterium xiamenense TaxID=1297121 RepID=UPI0035D079A7
MDLKAHYRRLHGEALNRIRQEGFSFDPLLLDPTDTRKGLTLLLRPNTNLLRSFSGFVEAVQRLAPGHHGYPPSDMHVTLMPLVSCYPEFRLGAVDLPAYIERIEESLRDIPPIQIEFKGVFASSSCLMIQGYPLDAYLEESREHLRRLFKHSGLEQSLDQRYRLVTAHCTLIRFQKPVSRTQTTDVLALLDHYRDHFFGCQHFEQVEFVCNDWYQRQKNVTLIQTFSLSGKRPDQIRGEYQPGR